MATKMSKYFSFKKEINLNFHVKAASILLFCIGLEKILYLFIPPFYLYTRLLNQLSVPADRPNFLSYLLSSDLNPVIVVFLERYGPYYLFIYYFFILIAFLFMISGIFLFFKFSFAKYVSIWLVLYQFFTIIISPVINGKLYPPLSVMPRLIIDAHILYILIHTLKKSPK